jgi:hypothetical protein
VGAGKCRGGDPQKSATLPEAWRNAGDDDGQVTTHRRARLVLDFDVDAEPVSGVVVHEDHDGKPFSGWMALTRTIEETLNAARHPQPDEDLQGAPEGRP